MESIGPGTALALTAQHARREGEQKHQRPRGVTALERIVTLIVYVAIIALLLWFLLFAGPPLPSQLTDHGVR